MSLAESLALVRPDLPPELVPAAARDDLDALARGLAPVHRAGFEVRLGDSPQVDLQQGFAAGDGELARLRAHLTAVDVDEGVRDRLGGFLAACEDAGSPLHGAVRDLWLEFDRPPVAALSVFAGFHPGRSAAAPDAVGLLAGGAAAARFARALERCLAAVPPGAHLSHVGLMLGRPTPLVRVNVKRLAAEQVGPFLRDAGWPADGGDAEALARRLGRHADGVTLCLDLTERVAPRLGLECHLDRQPPAEPRWRDLLDELVAAGSCTAAKRDALLAWAGRVVPAAAPAPWPADLVLASLRRPPDHFTCLDRQLSHVKVEWAPGTAPAAKGYFGFVHRWLRPGPGDGPPRRRPRGGAPRGVAGAVDFLLAAREPAGWWRDFAGVEGATDDWARAFGWSDEWVTAFAGTALAGAPDARARDAARRAWSLLTERRLPAGGWGYNRL
ncbi:MAG TPA: hypothetical protein VHF89_20270, partial [Solirubrobacteraceae bacterium]|nr:hypothetical protein [Solirubrobacteraceae bacterium]